jgi:hypothetical protein
MAKQKEIRRRRGVTLPAPSRWKLDYEIEAATDKRISASWLRKDRVGPQIFPFHRVGRLCFYDLDEIDAVIEGSRHGGKGVA